MSHKIVETAGGYEIHVHEDTVNSVVLAVAQEFASKLSFPESQVQIRGPYLTGRLGGAIVTGKVVQILIHRA